MNILLAITGGIAAYKTPELVRRLQDQGATVRCMATDSALRMVAPDALIAVSGHAVASSLWAGDGSMPHIDLPRWCDRLLIAPATANILAKCRLGLADDLLTTAFLALEPEKPIYIAPAMNTVMWQKPIVQENLNYLKNQGCRIIPPVSGELACGESGVGAMAEPTVIASTTCEPLAP